MSKYTTEVRFICESIAGLTESAGYNSIDSILNESIPKIFDFDYPIFDENYRRVLEKKILKHYYTREICMETYGLWKLKLDDKMNLIMPYYNELYKSAALEFNPFWDVDLTTDHVNTNTGESLAVNTNTRKNDENVNGSYNDKTHGIYSENGEENRTSTANEEHEDERHGTDTNTRWDLYSDTPQGGIQGIANADDPSLANNAYLTNARRITDNGTDSDITDGTKNTTINDEINRDKSGNNDITKNGTSNNKINQTITDNGNLTTNINNTEDYLQHIKGKRGGKSYSKLLEEYRKTFLNIDKLIIEELSDLFFGLWE